MDQRFDYFQKEIVIIVSDFCQVILEQAFSFAPVGNLSAHQLVESYLALLVAALLP